jgi:hypothetical protein
MFEFAPGWGWLFLAYTVGTVFGLWYTQKGTIEKTIDSLIANGYLKHRRKADGEIEILKYNEE